MKNEPDIPISKHDLRALCFWATVGIRKSKAGSYPDASEREGDYGIINSYAEHIKFRLHKPPIFGADLK